MCRIINFKFDGVNGVSSSLLYDLVDNEGNYVFQELSGTQLLSGLTLSISPSATSFNLNSNRLSGTWSLCNPRIPGINAP